MQAERVRRILEDCVKEASALGARDVVACFQGSVSEEAAVRDGAVESLTRSAGESLSLRVFVGEGCADVSCSDLTRSPKQLAQEAYDAARLAPPDPYAGPADADALSVERTDIQFPAEDLPSPADLTAYALAAEEAARALPGVTGGDGAECSAGRSVHALARADGAFFWRERGSAGASVSVRAGSEAEGGMERDYAWRPALRFADLPEAASLGRDAAERALRRLRAVRPESGRYDIVFEPRMARTLLSCFLSAANGASAARGGSFLCGKLGQAVFASGITIECDPTLPGGLGSAVFDAEGVGCARLPLVLNGVFGAWLLDSRSARKLGLRSNGYAQGGVAPAPGARNAAILNGEASPSDLIRSVRRGIYITDTFGGGVNEVTGDFSRGMSGVRIENGELTEPLNEFTVAGTLPEMFARVAAANDLGRNYGSDSPTLLIEDMAVAGS